MASLGASWAVFGALGGPGCLWRISDSFFSGPRGGLLGASWRLLGRLSGLFLLHGRNPDALVHRRAAHALSRYFDISN